MSRRHPGAGAPPGGPASQGSTAEGLVSAPGGISNGITKETSEARREWIREFDAAARRPLAQRFRYAFIRTHKPVLDDARYRSFESTADYRRWCEENLPDWLGYGRV